MIATLLWFGGGAALPRLAVILAWGSVAGSALQFAVQLPVVWRVAPDLRFALDTTSAHVRTIGRNFVPVLISRGVVQVSAYIDQLIASLLPHRRGDGPAERVDALHAAGEPVRHVGVGRRAAGDVGDRRRAIRRRSRSCASASTPACAGSRSSSCRRRWRFSRSATWWPARCSRPAASTTPTRSTCGGFSPDRRSACSRRRSAGSYSSTYYALRDTRTPLRYALVRVVLTTVLGYLFAIPLPRALGLRRVGRRRADGVGRRRRLGGDAAAAATLNARIGRTGLPAAYVAQLWGAAIAGAAVALGRQDSCCRRCTRSSRRSSFSARTASCSSALTLALRIPEASSALGRPR